MAFTHPLAVVVLPLVSLAHGSLQQERGSNTWAFSGGWHQKRQGQETCLSSRVAKGFFLLHSQPPIECISENEIWNSSIIAIDLFLEHTPDTRRNERWWRHRHRHNERLSVRVEEFGKMNRGMTPWQAAARTLIRWIGPRPLRRTESGISVDRLGLPRHRCSPRTSLHRCRALCSSFWSTYSYCWGCISPDDVLHHHRSNRRTKGYERYSLERDVRFFRSANAVTPSRRHMVKNVRVRTFRILIQPNDPDNIWRYAGKELAIALLLLGRRSMLKLML